MSGAVPPPGRPSSGAGSQGSASRVSRVRSVRAWGPSTGPTACALAGWRCSLWGWRKGVPGGGCFPPLCGAPCVRRCPSPGRPSSGAGSKGSASGVSWVWSVQAWGPSTGPTACALAGRRCSLWGWRKGVSWGGAFHHCQGRLRSGAVPPPTARPLGGLFGLVGCVRCVWCLCRACRGVWCRSSLVPLVLPSPVSRCGAVFAVCLPCPLPCARPFLGRWPPLVPFVSSLLFTLSSTLLPDMHFFPASALLRISVFLLAGSPCSLVGLSPLYLHRERV